MKEGINTHIKFHKYESPYLKLKQPKNSYQYKNISNCGTAALSLLTGLTPNYVQSKCTYDPGDGWYGDDMVKFLRNRGYYVVEVTKKNVTNTDWKDYPLTPNHCLLIITTVEKEECSAIVVHKNKLWHNLKTEDFTPLFFLNKPTVQVYIVSHNRWRYDYNAWENKYNFS